MEKGLHKKARQDVTGEVGETGKWVGTRRSLSQDGRGGIAWFGSVEQAGQISNQSHEDLDGAPGSMVK